jgi:hypothetical protein
VDDWSKPEQKVVNPIQPNPHTLGLADRKSKIVHSVFTLLSCDPMILWNGAAGAESRALIYVNSNSMYSKVHWPALCLNYSIT